MQRFVAALILGLLLAGCATTQLRSAAQKMQQVQSLRANSTALSAVQLGASTGEVRGVVGAPISRTIFLETYTSEAEIWIYPSEEGYTTLTFSDGLLKDRKLNRTKAAFARDMSIPITDGDFSTHLFLSMVKLGWTKADVDRLPLKAKQRLSEVQTSELYGALKAMMAQLQNNPIFAGTDMSVLDRDNSGELWVYLGDRLGGSLLFRRGSVVQIVISENPTKTQQDEMMQQIF